MVFPPGRTIFHSLLVQYSSLEVESVAHVGAEQALVLLDGVAWYAFADALFLLHVPLPITLISCW